MQTTTESFETRATWSGNLTAGRGELSGTGLAMSHSAPARLGGPGTGTNPEELLSAAASSCILMTLAGILGARGASVGRADCHTQTTYALEATGPRLAGIQHDVTLQGAESDLDLDKLALQLERGCMVSRALASDIKVVVRVSDGNAAGVGK